MPPDGLGRGDVERALDALASEAPAPTGDAAAVVARGRRRVVRRRATAAAIVIAVIATAASVSAVATRRDATRVLTPPSVSTTAPTTTTPTDASQYDPLSVTRGSTSEVWICGRPFQYGADAGGDWGAVRVPPPKVHTSRGEFEQPTLCTAAPGAAWLVRAADGAHPEVVRVRKSGQVSVFPFENLLSSETIKGITFLDSETGWAVVQSGIGDPVDTELFATVDGGKTWLLRNAHAPIHLGRLRMTSYPISFVTETDGWALGRYNQVEHTSDGGRTWDATMLPVPNEGLGANLTSLVTTPSGALVVAGTVLTGNSSTPFVDVSTDGGATWNSELGPTTTDLDASVPTDFDATDADHWQFSYGNRLFTTADGTRWTQVAEFAGMDHITSLAFLTPKIGIVSGAGATPSDSSVALQTNDGGRTWKTVGWSVTPIDARGLVLVNFPGGIIGCPTRPLTAAASDAGVAAAARDYVQFPNPIVEGVYRTNSTEGDFARVFSFNLGSCGQATLDNTRVAYVHGVPNAGPGGSTARVTLAVAHYADGWHVYGRYP